MAKKRRRYTDEFRANTVLLLQGAGYPDQKGALARVSSNVGVAHSTISRWVNASRNPPPSKLVHEKRFDLIEAINHEIEGILGEMPGARKDADYRTLGTVLGIMVDKRELLSGNATARPEFTWQKEVEEAGINAGELFEQMVQTLSNGIIAGDRGDDSGRMD